ncbi:MAG: hypothetical protein V4510_05645 [bacterium]
MADESGVAGRSRHSRWSVVGSGEGGTRIASLYFSKTQHPSVGNRILLLNSNPGDLANILDELRIRLDDSAGSDRIDEISKGHVVEFGEHRGAGNLFTQGEDYAVMHFETNIRRKMLAVGIGQGDALISLTTLGGGTGNGSVPYIIRSMKSKGGLGLDKVHHFAVAAWPFENEDKHRHFNAVAGLSRLLMQEDTGMPNADWVMLCDNSRLASLGDAGEAAEADFYDINRRIADALDLLTAGGRRAVNVIDVEDLIRLPGKMGLTHFTCGLSLGNDPDIVELELALDFALKESFVEVDPKSVLVAYLIVRVPEELLGKHDFTAKGVLDTFTKWQRKNLSTVVGMSSLTVSDQDSSGFDVLLVLGGFDLRPLLRKPLKHFDQVSQMLTLQPGNEELGRRLKKIKANLDGYLDRVKRAQALMKEAK